MMLYLLKQQNGATIHYLAEQREYRIGRKNGDIILNNDQSLSRNHAIIKIGDDSAKLIDCGSKYGTARNNCRIEANTDVSLEDKDVIKFGVFESCYIVEKINIVTTASGLNNTQKGDLRKDIKFLGGVLTNDWNSMCTHITLHEIILSIKVLHALIDEKPFVTPEYWSQFVASVKAMSPPPKIDNFNPEVAEALISRVHLTANPERKMLFKDKIFVFASEKIKSKMEGLIEKTGGSSISWDKQPLSLAQINNAVDHYLFIDDTKPEDMPQSFKDAQQQLRKLNRRTIPIQEIAMAVIICSCEKDCNPKFNRLERVFVEQESSAESQVFALASETPSQDLSVKYPKDVIIPGSPDDLEMLHPVQHISNIKSVVTSITSLCNPSCSVIKRAGEHSQESPFKKIKHNDTRVHQETSLSVRKRKADESLSPLSKKSTLRQNPFAVFKNKILPKKTDADNPFAALRIPKEVNQFEDTQVTTKEAKGSTSIQSVMEKSVVSPNFISNTRSGISQARWLSKSDCTAAKIEIRDEFKEIFDKFQGSVVIEVMASALMRNRTIDSIDANVSNDLKRKNFKKFKKVPPLKPQINIITTSVVQSKTHEVTILSESDGEAEDIPRPVVKKNKSKRFNF